MIVIVDKINNSHTFGGRVSNVIYFFTQYDEEKAELLNKIKPDFSLDTQRFLSEWQAAHEINAWFRAEVGVSPDPITAMKSLETLTDQKRIAQLEQKRRERKVKNGWQPIRQPAVSGSSPIVQCPLRYAPQLGCLGGI
ncbi:hypothetical protein [Escherichia sp. E1130]|uniref:hypothetical protein n=1 Tax=Escherichia sp. E1130 TaxID=2041645 RepID=UPI0010806054|nr:hypothetical protein [Escherichia sp. E1130]TGC20905.1 hypothetical protein CQJ27_25720 [Escherichia sp. E1130]